MGKTADEVNARSPDPGRHDQLVAEKRSDQTDGNNAHDTQDIPSESPAQSDADRAMDPEPAAAEQIARLAEFVRPRRGHEEDWSFFREALPEYDVKERIHYGGQGVVYRAFHRVAKRTVAIKVLLDGPLASERQRQRLTREMELVARLRHPNIVTLYETGEVRGRPFFVMEYVDGLAIDDYVLVNDLSVRQIVETFKQVCDAVGSAHERGVIHRDIKPPNILVNARGKVLVLDFGLARDAEGSDSDGEPMISVSGQIVGTLPYLSPEQAGGKNRDVDIRSDIYALGVVLFELITGTYPYPMDGSPEEVRATIMLRDPMRPRKALGKNSCDRPGVLRDVNDDLERIVLKALAKEKERRYHSAASLADDLQRYLNGEAVDAKAASSLYVLRKSLRRFRLQVAASLIVLTALVSAGIWVGAERIRTRTVADTYKRGLQMGGLMKLGAVRADEGRFAEALALLESVIEIGKTVPRNDRVAQRYQHEALVELAALHLETGNHEQADRHARASLTLADQILREHPGDPEWLRLKALSLRRLASVASSRGDLEAALAAINQTIGIRSDLADSESENLSLKYELADGLSLRGGVLSGLKRHDQAFVDLESSHELQSALVRLEPEVSTYVLGLGRTEAQIAGHFIRRKTTADDQSAVEWLNRAAQRLIALRDSKPPEFVVRSIDQLLVAISQNQTIAENNARARARQSRPPEEQLADAMAARDLYEQLAELEPEVDAHVISLARTELRIAVRHMERHTLQDYNIATDHLDNGLKRLTALRDAGHSLDRIHEVTTLMEKLSANLGVIERNKKLLLSEP